MSSDNSDSVNTACFTDEAVPGSNVSEEQAISGDVDSTVTLNEIIEAHDEDDKRNSETARALFGGQDDTVCTYPEGYKPRQTLFACLTCTTDSTRAGICYGCSINCHDGHNIVELYTKRKFRCDCGNSKFGDFKCSLYEEKAAENANNIYNDNFIGLFCVCKKTYPDETITENMYQCCVCEDWYHTSHLVGDDHCDDSKWKAVDDAINSLVCTTCATKKPFLSYFENIEEVKCLKDFVDSEVHVSGPLSLRSEWRKFLCACTSCENFLDSVDCLHFLDKEDDIDEFEKENIEMSEEHKEPDNGELVDALVKETGPENAVGIMKGFMDFQGKLKSFLSEKASSGEVVTKDHVSSFFQQLKRARIETLEKEVYGDAT